MSLRKFRSANDLSWAFPEVVLHPGEEVEIEMDDSQPCPQGLIEILPKGRKLTVVKPSESLTEPDPAITKEN